MMRVQNGNYQAVCLPLAVWFSVVISVCFQFVVEMWVWSQLPRMRADRKWYGRSFSCTFQQWSCGGKAWRWWATGVWQPWHRNTMERSGLCCPEICSEGITVQQDNFSSSQQQTAAASRSFSAASGFEMHFVFVVLSVFFLFMCETGSESTLWITHLHFQLICSLLINYILSDC